MLTLKKFTEQSNVPASLIRAVVRQVGGWTEFKEMAQDVCEHGADGGFSGFIYYKDTCAFYAKNQKAIVEYAKVLADDLGCDSAISLVAGFNCMKDTNAPEEIALTLYGTKRQHDIYVANALAWFALEEVCRAFCDLKGEYE